MSTTPTLTPRLIGETEKSLNAILDRLLAGTNLNEHQWVTLTLTMSLTGDGPIDREDLVGRVAHALKVDDAAARARIDELKAAGLLDVPDGEGAKVSATGSGQNLHTRVRTGTAEIVDRLWGDLPAEDLAVAARVLSVVRDRANGLD
jgi:hypothetical protein